MRSDGYVRPNPRLNALAFLAPIAALAGAAAFASATRPAHEISLTAVVFKDTGWTRHQVIAELEKASAMLEEQCGITTREIVVSESDPLVDRVDVAGPWDFRSVLDFSPSDLNDAESLTYRAAALLLPKQRRPALFFFRAALSSGAAFSYRQVDDSPLSGTAWIGSEKPSDPAWKEAPASYSAVAHELAHVLTGLHLHSYDQSEHILANPYRLRKGIFLPWHCELMRASRWVRRP